jgi:hypothetical protein
LNINLMPIRLVASGSHDQSRLQRPQAVFPMQLRQGKLCLSDPGAYFPPNLPLFWLAGRGR